MDKQDKSAPPGQPIPLDYHSDVGGNRRRSRLRLYLFASIGMAMAVLIMGPLRSYLKDRKGTPAPPPIQIKLPPAPTFAATVAEIARQRATPSLDWADTESLRIVADEIYPVGAFFSDAKARTPGFSKEILGWSSKWRLVADKSPFTRTNRHAEYLNKTFNERIFAPAQLAQVIDQVVKNYLNSITSIEARMLVMIRADVRDLPLVAIPVFGDEVKLKEAFNLALVQASQLARADLKANVTEVIVSTVVGEVLAMVAVRLGVSAGILTTGAGSSWSTFGIGLVAGLLVDQVVSQIWDWWRDPVGDLTAKMNDKLEHIHRLIIDGDGAAAGLRGRLEELSKKRAALRRTVVMELLQPSQEKNP